jgi:predicted MPP superfamily phosphohydrolase
VTGWLIFLIIALAIFAPFNYVTVRQLLRFHPRRKRWIIAAAVIGNLLWPVFPLIRSFTPFGRLIRAILGPPWFAWAVFTILYTAMVVAALMAWLLVRRRTRFTEFGRWPSRAFLLLALIGSITGFYQAVVPLRVERVPVFLRNLPADAEGTRIALLSDLHVGLFTRRSRLQTIFDTTRDLQPHLVLLAGDMIDDDPYFVPKLLEATRLLDPSTPLLAVLGNHEIYGDPFRVIEAMKGSRIRLLVNESFPWKSISIAGISDYASSAMLAPDVARATRGTMFPILLSHQPKAFDEARRRNIELTLVGHTHGGQCGIRPVGWSLAGVFLPYHMGLYKRGESQLYVNTGTGYWLVPFRLGMTPEITLIELRRDRR